MRIATCVVATLLLARSIGFAQTVTYDFDKAADFSSFKTYAWGQGTTLSDELNHERVVHAVDSELVRKGLVSAEPDGGSDVIVVYRVSFERDLEFNGSSTGWGPYGIGSRIGSVRSQEILVGTLTVEMTNALSRKVVWRGIASMDIDRTASPEKRQKSINKAVEKIFKNYPRAS